MAHPVFRFSLRSLLILVTVSALVVYLWPRPEVPGLPNLVGRITNANGQPIEGAKVEIFGGMATRFKFGETKTDENGWYAFKPVKGGTLIRDAEGADFGYLSVGMRLEHSTHVSSDGNYWWDESLPYVEGKPHVKNFTLVAGGTIFGRVVNVDAKPMADFDMRMDVTSTTGAAYLRYITTDESGNFKATGLPAGNCVIKANDGDWVNRAVLGVAVVVSKGETELRIELPDDFQ
jgi:hypothetical protein